MPVVLLRLPDQCKELHLRPPKCPRCGSPILHRWGRTSKAVQDIEDQQANLYRYRCLECSYTFRYYPRGIDRSAKTLRIRQLAGLACAMGMSSRDVAAVFGTLGVPLSHSTIWRDSQKFSAWLSTQKMQIPGHSYVIDTQFIPNVSNQLGVIVAINLGNGKSVVLGTLDEYNPRLVKSWLEALVKDVDIEVSVLGTDKLNSMISAGAMDG